jgi:hypothetical protein
MPKYEPPRKDPAGAAPAEEPDRPKNSIPGLPFTRLPDYIVRGTVVQEIPERDLCTRAALAKIAEKRYLSEVDSKFLNKFEFFSTPGYNKKDRAMEMYGKAEMAKLNGENAEFNRLTDAERTAPLRKRTQPTEAPPSPLKTGLPRAPGP